MQKHSLGRAAGLAAASVAALIAPAMAAAQATTQPGALDPQCAALTSPAERPLQDACQKSVDIFDLVAPQLGPGIAGGNALLGGGAALGGLGRISIGVRANVVRGRLPRLVGVGVSTAGARASDFQTTEPTVYIPTADAALGLFGGFDLGAVRVGGLDALGSLTYVPDYDGPDVSVAVADRRVQVGYGARLGLVQESLVVPGVGVTYLRRDLPEAAVLGRVAASGGERNDTIGVEGLRTRTEAWRVVASKTVSVLTVSAGAGQDRYRSRARVGAVLNETVPFLGPIRAAAAAFDLDQRLTRTSYFADLSLTLPVFVLSGEVGRAQGGRVRRSFNTFDGQNDPAAEPVTYYAAGVRLRF
jgi:hypothetical protein